MYNVCVCGGGVGELGLVVAGCGNVVCGFQHTGLQVEVQLSLVCHTVPVVHEHLSCHAVVVFWCLAWNSKVSCKLFLSLPWHACSTDSMLL
jgi:hypothetical protein